MRSMIRFGLVVGIALALGCAGKKIKVDEPPAGGALAGQSDRATENSNLLAAGSDSGGISGLNSVHFDFDRAVVRPGERPLLQQDAAWIAAHPGTRLQLEGHCDGRGSVEYNLALGDRRARAVLNALTELGVDKNRLSVISYGKERPLESGESDEAFAKNRRVNFVPLPEVSNLKASTAP